jgi:hypothetical protein
MTTYIWDAKLGRYQDTSNNRFVSRTVVLKHIERQNGRSKVYLQKTARSLVEGKISLSQFQALTIEELKGSHIRMASLAAGGRAEIPEFDSGIASSRTAKMFEVSSNIASSGYKAIEQRLKEEYRYLSNFVGAISRGELTPDKIVYRSGLYANSSAAAFYASEKNSRMKNRGDRLLLAKRDLDSGASKHCRDCPRFSTKGKWLEASLVVVPTRQCTCRNKCRCRIQYKYAIAD